MIKEKIFLIGFMEQFNQRIREGTKVVTIREHRKDGRVPKENQILRMYNHLRTKKCKPVFDFKNGETEPRCTGVWPIEIFESGNKFKIYSWVKIKSEFFKSIFDTNQMQTYLHNEGYPNWILEKLATMDGWNNFSEMYAYFKQRMKKDVFNGNLICWGKR